MTQINPNSIWVMQAWINTPHKEVIMGVPAKQRKRLLIIDLYCERYPIAQNKTRWLQTKGFWGVNWCWASVNYFGGRLGLEGYLDNLNQGPFLSKKHPYGKSLTGIGSVPESIGQGTITFDLLFEPVWRTKPANMSKWIRQYHTRRYGKYIPSIEQAWQQLYKTAYTPNPKHHGQGPFSSLICARPTINGNPHICCSTSKPTFSGKAIKNITKLFLADAKQLKTIDTYQYDTVNITRQMLVQVAVNLYQQMVKAYRKKDLPEFDKSSATFLELIQDMDTLLGTRKEFMMGTWINDATSWGKTQQEKKYYKKYAKTLVTVWCNKDYHHEYACREWNGLIKKFYLPRWRKSINKWHDQLQNKKHPLNIKKWEHNWAKNSKTKFQSQPKGDPIKIAQQMYNKWAKFIK